MGSTDKIIKSNFTRSDLFVLLICSLGQFIVVLDASIINIALPTFRQDLNFTATELQWAINSYTVLFASLLIVGGYLSDTFGPRIILIIGSLVFGLTCLVAGLIPEPMPLIVCRAVQGISAGLIAPATLSIIALRFGQNADLRGKAYGTWGAVASAGGAVGVLMGGIITQWLSWQWIFWINIPFLAMLLLFVRRVGDTTAKRGSQRVAISGLAAATIAAVGLFLVILSLVQISSMRNSYIGLLEFCIAILLLFVFWKYQSNLESPIIPKILLKSSDVIIGNSSALVSSGSIFVTYYFLTILMQAVLGYSHLKTGVAYLPMTVAMFVFARVAGAKMTPRLGGINTNIIGLSVSGIALLVIALSIYLGSTSYFPWLFVASVLLGVGQGIITTSSSMLATEGVDWKFAGTASALVNSSRQVGGALLLAIIVSALSAFYDGNDMLASKTSYIYAISAAAAVLLLSAVVFFFINLKRSNYEGDDAKRG